jgi:hypothetical protein
MNGKYYFGVHKTENPYDKYLGSGNLIRRAIAKYGEESFIKNVCFIFGNPEEAFAKEFELIEMYREDPLCYNLRQGGSGGFDWINKEGKNNLNQNYLKANEARGNKWKVASDEHKARWVEYAKKASKSPNWLIGVLKANKAREGTKHTPDAIEKMVQAGRLRTGERNGRFGSRWVSNSTENRCVKADEVEGYLHEGWALGKMKRFNLVCKKCGVSFQSKLVSTVYCSPPCRKVQLGETDCAQCGVHFLRGFRNARFCSKKCSILYAQSFIIRKRGNTK